MILIVSTPGDEHALAVQAELSRRKAQSKLLDLSEFPQNLGLSIRYKAGEGSFAFGCEGSSLDLEECGAIWWRRPQQPQISSDILRTTHRHFAFNESVEALQGLWHALQPFWINDPARDYVAQRKVYQLRVAQEVGLTVPETLITNCTRAAGDFVRQQGAGRVIYKSFSALENEWRETRLLAENEVQLLDNVRYAPVIFQEYIEASVDLRVTVVGAQIFAAAVHSQDTAYKVDCRIDISNARIEAVELPPDIHEKLLSLMGAMGLVYGAIDMRRTPDGRYIFLEINPAGQWLFIEHYSKQPITAALASKLLEHDR